jgi:nucleoside-diphosphate-sugar epimerase
MALLSDVKSPVALVTGARGFTGVHFCNALRAKGYEVHGLGRDEVVSGFSHPVDLADCNNLTAILEKIRPDYIIHLAAISFVAHGCANDFYQTNLFGTLNLLDAVQQAGLSPRKILIASSANVYGNPTQEIIHEDIPPLPISHYANSKLAMENMVRLWFDRLPIVITRPFNYTGPGQTENFLVPKIIAHFRDKKKVIKLGNIDVIRDISDVGMIVDCYTRLLESPVSADIFNICSGQGYSLSAILEQVQDLAGYQIEVEVDPALVRANEIKKLIGSNQKFREKVGEITVLPLSETLKSMYSMAVPASLLS